MRLSRAATAQRSGWAWVGSQAVIVLVAVACYFRVRGLTDASPQLARVHAEQVMALERWLGVDWEVGVQALVLPWRFAVSAANWIYIYGHWPVIAATLLWLAVKHREAFVRLRDAMLTSGAVGLVIFAVYPLAPPRLADPAIIDTVTQGSRAYRVLQPPAFTNQYAAMPSLHAGWDLLVGLTIAGVAGAAWLRWAGRLLPVLMVFAVVATGNHFVLDVVAGVALSLAGLAVARHLTHARRPPRPAPIVARHHRHVLWRAR